MQIMRTEKTLFIKLQRAKVVALGKDAMDVQVKDTLDLDLVPVFTE